MLWNDWCEKHCNAQGRNSNLKLKGAKFENKVIFTNYHVMMLDFSSNGKYFLTFQSTVVWFIDLGETTNRGSRKKVISCFIRDANHRFKLVVWHTCVVLPTWMCIHPKKSKDPEDYWGHKPNCHHLRARAVMVHSLSQFSDLFLYFVLTLEERLLSLFFNSRRCFCFW